MAKGIKLPVRVGPSGGVETIEGSNMIRQNIELGVRPASNMNPWNQKLTPRENIVFDINDDIVGGEFESHVYDLFEDLERLNQATIQRGRGTGIFLDTSDATREKGNLDIGISYTDLEEMESREIRFPGGKK